MRLTVALTEGWQLIEVVLVSFGGGIGVTIIYSFAVFGFARSGETRRAGKRQLAITFALVGTISLLIFAGLVGLAIQIIQHK